MKPSDSVASDDSADDSAADIYDCKINQLNNKLYNQSDSDVDSAEELENIFKRRKGTSTTCTQQTSTEGSQQQNISPVAEKKVQKDRDLIESIDEVSDDSDISILETSIHENGIVQKDAEEGLNDVSLVSEYDTSCPEEISFQEYDYTVKMYYNFKIFTFDMTSNTSLSVALKDLTDKLNKPANSIVLRHEDKPVPFDATPATLQLRVTDILEACDYICDKSSSSSSKPQKHPDELELILQDGRSRNGGNSFNFFKNQPFSELKKLYAEKASVDVQRVHLQFDGDQVDESETPIELGLEDGDVIDVQIVDSTE